jgi:hypothetical protein
MKPDTSPYDPVSLKAQLAKLDGKRQDVLTSMVLSLGTTMQPVLKKLAELSTHIDSVFDLIKALYDVCAVDRATVAALREEFDVYKERTDKKIRKLQRNEAARFRAALDLTPRKE